MTRRAVTTPAANVADGKARAGLATLADERDKCREELAEALEQQAATAEILRAISASPTDAQPVFDTIVQNTARLCRANFAFVMLNESGWLKLAARTDCTAEFADYLQRGFEVDRRTTTGRAVVMRGPVQILDFLNDPETLVTPAHRAEPIRTVLAVPLLRDGAVLGVIAAWRREVRPFSDRQVQLLKTFADQAVIAVANLHMFEEIQRKERALTLANQAQSRFLAAASHDLRQPMHALTLFIGQLRASRAPAERAKLVARIEEAAGSLAELLDQLLDLSKLEAGAVQAAPLPFAMRDVLAAIDMQFAPLARAKGLELHVRASRAVVSSDPVLVQRVLLNLVGNAIRYTERGGVLVGCRRRAGALVVAVWDTGCGIPAERHDDVFREFVQLGARGRENAGLGLGLAIVTRLADLLHTRIELRSTVGRGSMFAFELPLADSHQRSPAAPLRIASLRGVFALVVDDDETTRVGTSGLLQSWGCLTEEAADAGQALERLQTHDRPPELIVCDYQLAGGANGADAIARIRAAVGEATPAVIVTGDTAAEAALAAQALGAPLLHKPVSPVKLRALLARLVAAGATVAEPARSGS